MRTTCSGDLRGGGGCAGIPWVLCTLWLSTAVPVASSSSWVGDGRGLSRTAESRAAGFVRCPTLCVCQVKEDGKAAALLGSPKALKERNPAKGDSKSLL
ncbi:hypothetical protein IscW_ISCW017486 [Ixodes scapularis]|uniref:Secreted protein n=1 Tax=Ixodes scapularis TaxID=6945 RepID=B7P8I7_IXOSC|nr:hypothetical protein IscW_ISCW017486 [Ixodes scapularis]|eukprot:XP_002402145.1 hypothetical protein IscW_ISCW017486 [Ixodes scapularis]